MELNPKINTGLIYEEKPSDLLGGSIPFESRNTTANWLSFLSTSEIQKFRHFDSQGCVTFSAMNNLECQFNWALDNDLLTSSAIKFFTDNGYIVDGKFNFSDRFIAKLSGTTRQGNTFQKVWDAIRTHGLVPESKWPSSESFDWDSYYSPIPNDVLELGLTSLKFFEPIYERLTDLSSKNLDRELKHAPIQLGVATCSPWDSEVPVCDAQPNHAILLYDVDNGYNIEDHYDPHKKKLLPGYKIWFAYKAVLFPKVTTESPIDPDHLFSDLKLGDSGEKVIKLKRCLDRLGFFTSDNSSEYDEGLASVVYKYQLANLPRLSWAFWYCTVWWDGKFGGHKGRIVDESTRKTINNALLYRK